MISAGVGFSLQEDAEVAGREAARQALERCGAPPKALVVFATPAHGTEYPSLLREIRQTAGTDKIVGCSAVGVIAEKREIDVKPAVAVLAIAGDSLFTQPFLCSNLYGRSEAVGREIGEAASKQGGKNLVAVFPDTFTFHPSEFLRGIREEGNPPVVGGGASEDGRFQRTFQFEGESVDTDAVSGIILSGALRYELGVTQACRPVGESLLVTRAEGRTICELSGRPAVEALRERLKGELGEALRDHGGQLFLAYPGCPERSELSRGEYLVRNVAGINEEEGTITSGDEIAEGQIVAFAVRDGNHARTDLIEMLAQQKVRQTAPPAFAFYFNCCGRGRGLYGDSDVDSRLINNALGDFPLIGFSSFCELAPIGPTNLLHNYSGVLTLIYPE